MKINENSRQFFLNILAAAIGAFLAVSFQQLYHRQNEEIDLRKKHLIENLSLYNKISRFAELGIIHFSKVDTSLYAEQHVTVYINESTNETIKIDTINTILGHGDTVQIPSVTINFIIQDEWNKVKNEIMKQRDDIDPDIYKKFKSIILYVEKNSFPSSIYTVNNSVWVKKETMEEWFKLNSSLYMAVDDFRKLK